MDVKTKMNTALGKRILSVIRDGEAYAHPGEEDAIDLTFKAITKDKNRRLLDVGCGLGGTAKYLEENGYGKVTGIDLNAEGIEFAKEKYPDLELFVGDVCEAGKILKDQFDLIYHFCSFYAFPDQPGALSAIRQVAHKKSELIIFDYARQGEYKQKVSELLNPLDLDKIEIMLKNAKWELTALKDISDYYLTNYAKFLEKVDLKRDAIIDMSDETMFLYVKKAYTNIYNAYKNKILKAVILYARAL